MTFVPLLILGLISAVIAKSIMGVEGGWLSTALVAVGGTVVGGVIGLVLSGSADLPFFNLSSWALAVLGSVIVLWVYGRITSRR
jgi:uncharacterized membrane protein YeaQ/YmgE (transglycosylase-associated protein family)